MLKYTNNKMKLLLITLTLAIINRAKTDEATCTTPDDQKGKCISVYSCLYIADMIRTKQPEKIEFVKKSRCTGPQLYSVCCPDSEVNVREPETSATPNADYCGQDGTASNKIISGPIPYIDEYTWLALIEYVKDGQSKTLCGGTLISGKHVLTAAHCVTGAVADLGVPTNVHLGEFYITHKNPDCEEVPGGAIDCNDDLVIIPIKTIIVHPEYNPADFSRKHNIAIFHLAKMAPYTDFIHPICLPSSDLSTAVKPYESYKPKSGWMGNEWTSDF